MQVDDKHPVLNPGVSIGELWKQLSADLDPQDRPAAKSLFIMGAQAAVHLIAAQKQAPGEIHADLEQMLADIDAAAARRN